MHSLRCTLTLTALAVPLFSFYVLAQQTSWGGSSSVLSSSGSSAAGASSTTGSGTTGSGTSSSNTGSSTGTQTSSGASSTSTSSGNSSSGTYTLTDNYVGNSFFEDWNWFTDDDPTHGRVNYVDMNTAKSSNLSSATDSQFYMAADTTNTVNSSSRGRNSVRITSKKTYKDSIVVLDLDHMPTGCATWPAFWTVTDQTWPDGGEIDILEGVNELTTNQATLHTNSGCSMPSGGDMTGHQISTQCASSDSDNEGCAVQFSKQNNYGTPLNNVQGGWFVMTRSDTDGVSVYFWARNDGSVPSDIKNGAKSLSTGSWGQPEAQFPTTSCSFSDHFTEHNLVFDLTFCGDWAGSSSVFTCGGGQSCQDYVDNNPSDFKEAYWSVNAVRVYTTSS